MRSGRNASNGAAADARASEMRAIALLLTRAGQGRRQRSMKIPAFGQNARIARVVPGRGGHYGRGAET